VKHLNLSALTGMVWYSRV